MKAISFLKAICILCLIVYANTTRGQQTISFDLAGIRNITQQHTGMNVSCFYHFNEHIIGGLEVNRFFAVPGKVPDEDVEASAWDLDLNLHFPLSLNKSWMFYPVTGISHTSEKEHRVSSNENTYDRFWSFNTGAGILCKLGRLSPHAEYLFTWGHINQQFLLAGISYELEWGKEKK